MSSLSTMTVSELSNLYDAPVVQPTGPRKSKLIAIQRMAMIVSLKEKHAQLKKDKATNKKPIISIRQANIAILIDDIIKSPGSSYTTEWVTEAQEMTTGELRAILKSVQRNWKKSQKDEASLKAKQEKKEAKRAAVSAVRSIEVAKKKSQFTYRRLSNCRGENNAYLRVAIHKTTRETSKVNPKNWNLFGDRVYTETYPKNKDYKKSPSPSPTKRSPLEKEEKKARKAFETEMRRRAKAEADFTSKFSKSFVNPNWAITANC